MKKSEAKKLVGKKWGELSRAGKNSIIAAMSAVNAVTCEPPESDGECIFDIAFSPVSIGGTYHCDGTIEMNANSAFYASSDIDDFYLDFPDLNDGEQENAGVGTTHIEELLIKGVEWLFQEFYSAEGKLEAVNVYNYAGEFVEEYPDYEEAIKAIEEVMKNA